MAAPIPAELKPATAFLSRAHELREHDPVMAYWCNYHAAQVAMTLRPTETASRQFLFSLLDQLEESKERLSDNEAVTEEIAGAAYIENFAVKVFTQADNADRAGKATRATAKSFLAAANFYELLADFGETDPDVKDKIKYAKWKATDIVKAIKEGRTPTPGPAGGLEEEAEMQLPSVPLEGDQPQEDEAPRAGSSTSTNTEDEARAVEEILRGLNTSSDPVASTSASLDDSQATLRLPSPPADAATNLGLPSPSYPFPLTDESSMLDPSAPAFNPSTPSHPLPPASSSSNLPSAPPVIPDSSTYSPLPPTAPVPPAPLMRHPSIVPTPPASTPLFPKATQPTSSIPKEPVSPSPTPNPDAQYDFKSVSTAQKHAKFAISALNFDDLTEARKQLRKALEAIGG